MWICSFSRIRYLMNRINVSYLRAGMHTLIQLVNKNLSQITYAFLCLLYVSSMLKFFGIAYMFSFMYVVNRIVH